MAANLTIDDALRHAADEGYLSHFTLWVADGGRFQANFARTDSHGGYICETHVDPVLASTRALALGFRRKPKKTLDEDLAGRPSLQEAILSCIAKHSFGGLSVAPTSTGEWKAAYYRPNKTIVPATAGNPIAACLAAIRKTKAPTRLFLDEDLF